MRQLVLVAVAGAWFSSCSQKSEEQSLATDLNGESSISRPVNEQQTHISGEKAYQLVCSECHDLATSGAPLTGDQNAWKYRSPLWESVLAEHAKDGYLDMPSKGGSTELTDQHVTQAVEYMMLLTYPERLPD